MEKKFQLFDRKACALLVACAALIVVMMILGIRPTLDMKLYYTGGQARAFIGAMGQHARDAYFLNELFDLAFIFSYSSLFYVLAKKTFSKNPRAVLLSLLPGFFDLIETSFILYALRATGPQSFFDWLGVATFLKWAFSATVIATLLWGFFYKCRRVCPKT